jgi:DNA-binding response OmpR family regulator/DNA-binding CsgD family transcriptional regulator
MTTRTTFDGDVALIVDDVPENLSLLSDALSDAGYTVLVATDGLSALDRLQKVIPDIILLDAVMPGIDGFETCRRIKQMEAVRHVPVIFMTGLTETEHVLMGFESGGLDYITKPIEPVEVLARVATHIRNARMMTQVSDAIDAVAHAAISLTADGSLLWQTRQAAEWMEKYFPGTQAASQSLPPPITAWLKEAMYTSELDTIKRNTSPFLISQGNVSLHVTLSRRQRELLLLLEEKQQVNTANLDHYQLTPREIEVLAWVAKGKTNRDIADILGMSPRTVNKHLEHIFVKLGVETRSAAAALVAGKLS